MHSCLLVCLFLFLWLACAHAGDDICSATSLPIPSNSIVFDNTFNSNSSLPAAPFGGYLGPDTWIAFTMPNSPFYLLLDELTMVDPAIGIYAGPCDDPTLLYNVLDNNCNGMPSPELLIENLTPGETYYIRVWAENATTNGTFAITMDFTIPTLPNFIAFADAVVVDDCLQLTTETQSQLGCAWYQLPIDFNMAFSHSMVANFGDLDISGADGICLVYQSNGQDYCGELGGGIGAENMPNSAIFEFDTYQNGQFFDPAPDHASFNVNGNMSHANSISGPVTLGNIEDGLDHIIKFDWDPAGNNYSLFFDGLLLFSGSYDIINNCFGGNNMAYWGYTSATGGSYNDQIICPEIIEYEPSTVDYDLIVLCGGDDYLGYSQPGYYTDFTPGINGCMHQSNFLIKTYDLPEPEFIDTLVCTGGGVLILNEYYEFPSEYEIHTLSEKGCDSVIYLTLENLDFEIEFDSIPLLTCDVTNVDIGLELNCTYPWTDISYLWNNSETTSEINVTEKGSYTVYIEYSVGNVTCAKEATIFVDSDLNQPIITPINDILLNCSNIDSLSFLVANNSATTISSWWYQDSIISNQDTVDLEGEGIYVLQVQNLENGCEVYDTILVSIDDDIPTLDVSTQNLNCESMEVIPVVEVSENVVSFEWYLNGILIDSIKDKTITESGIYTLIAYNEYGCSKSKEIIISQDTIAPYIDILDGIIPCDSSGIQLSTDVESSYSYQLSGPEIIDFNTDSLNISTAGIYIVDVLDTTNGCRYVDSFLVSAMGDSPTISFLSDILDCETNSFELMVVSDISNTLFDWEFEGISSGTGTNILVSQPGTYYIEASTATGCISIDSIVVIQDIEEPTFALAADTLTCFEPSSEIVISSNDNYEFEWVDSNGNPSTDASGNISVAGIFYLKGTDKENGCFKIESVEVISTIIIPDFQIFDDTLNCIHPELNLNFNIQNNYQSLMWEGPNGFESEEVNPTISQPGVYEIFVSLNKECFLDTVIIISEDFELPDFEVYFNAITCKNEFADIHINGTQNSESVLVYPDGITDNIIDSIKTDVAGTYKAIVIGNNGCKDSISLEILEFTDKPPISATYDGDLTCFTPVSQLGGASVDEVSYYWTGPTGLIFNDSIIDVSVGGSYHLVIENMYGCQNDTTILVSEFLYTPEVELDGGELNCEIEEAHLVLLGDHHGHQIKWIFEGVDISQEPMLSVTKGGLYRCYVENEYGCIDSNTVIISQNTELPMITSLTDSFHTIYPEDPELELDILVNSTSDFSITWMPEEAFSCSDCFDPLLLDEDIEMFFVQVLNIHGCADTLRYNIEYKVHPNVIIPNIFSPNGDGQNDYFTLFGNDQIESILEMRIFDRWGSLVVSKSNILPNDPELGWNGNVGGNEGVSGVYVYAFKVVTTKGEVLDFYGDVTVIR